jgi:hypothetical protein
MMQGDSYGLAFEILRKDDTVVTADDISEVEITVGFLTKKFSTGGVTFDSDKGEWCFHLTQEETFKLPPVRNKVQVRVLWNSGAVEGVSLDGINVIESISKEVL